MFDDSVHKSRTVPKGKRLWAGEPPMLMVLLENFKKTPKISSRDLSTIKYGIAIVGCDPLVKNG